MVNHNVLILEGPSPIAIPILRSLAEKGVSTDVLASFPFHLSRFSKYCGRQFLVPSMAREKEFAKTVEKIVKKVKFSVLFPIFEWSLMPISKIRDRLSPYVRLPIASHESIQKCYDKLSTLKLATENDVPTPETFFVHNTAELKRVSKEINYPAVVKPRWSMIWRSDRAFYRRCGFVNSPAELIATYNSIHKFFPFPFIQEYIPGVNYSVGALYNEGNPRAFCCIKVHRAWPPTGGNSCFRESAPLSVDIKRYSEKLLKALNWHGIAEVEFRMDLRSGEPKLMEINPRFWGSLSVAIKAGVDFPYLLYRMALDGDVKNVFNYRVGVKGRYLEQDLIYIISLFKDASIYQDILSVKKLQVLLKWLQFYEHYMFYDLFDVNDPLPFFFSTALSPLGLIRFMREKNYAWSPPGIQF
ncbi:ATP-grasp domain-containing protein [Candidatus Bathyarchaeota archaeon]|nr:ATP-grasp domain-containing protein [Candidatus Bathyarchaeota archaeon]